MARPLPRGGRSQGEPETEIILVDNASGDGLVHFVRDEFPEVRVFALTRTGGSPALTMLAAPKRAVAIWCC